jgi:type I restriction-modification system DNA methylase subunit
LIANFIWGIADDVHRDLYVRGKYRHWVMGVAACAARSS